MHTNNSFFFFFFGAIKFSDHPRDTEPAGVHCIAYIWSELMLVLLFMLFS